MAEWREKSLGEITAIMTKGIAPRYVEVESAETIRVLNQKCNRDHQISYTDARLHNSAAKKVPIDKFIRGGDVLINSTGTGTAGRVAQIWEVPTPTTFDSHMILLRPTNEVDIVYYGYAVKACQKKIENLAEGSTGQTEINRRRLKEEIIIRYPLELDNQRKIGKFLLSIDEKIKLNKSINKNLTEQAQAIYSSMFIDDADPAWKQGYLSDLIIVKYGKDHKKLADGVYPVYGSGGIMRYVERPLYTCESVLIPRKGTLNNVTYVNEPFWSVDTMFYTEMRFPNVAKYVFHFLKTKNLASMNAGSAVPSMTTDILNTIELTIPSFDRLAKFETLITPMYQTMNSNARESIKLIKLRDTLLPRLISGEIDVNSIHI